MRRFYMLFTLSLIALGVFVMQFGASRVYAGDLAPNPTPVPPAVDTDNDGLPDTDDQCPTVAGPRENRGCPPVVVDTDNDGLPDSDDLCPTVAGPRENRGCPVTDSTSTPPPPTSNEPAPITTTAPPQPFTPPLFPPDGCYVTPPTNNNVNVRQDPDLNAAIIGQLFPSKVYSALGYIEKEGTFWFVLTNYEGTSGELGFASASVLMRSDCGQIAMATQNNLKQIGLAIHNYHDTALFDPVIDGLLNLICADSNRAGGANFVLGDGSVKFVVYAEIEASLTTDDNGDDPCAETPTAESTSEPTGPVCCSSYSISGHDSGVVLNFEEVTIGINEVEIDDVHINTNDDGSTTIEYCVYVELYEVGVFNEVCYQIEIPANCTLVSTEAGVYDVVCDGEATISLNPDIEGLRPLNITIPTSPTTPILIALLLPAVQA